MSDYEYRVIAAPTKGVKAKGRKSAEDRFCHALEMKINEMAREGWEYQRAEALPSTERSGLTSTKTVWHNLLVFRRLVSMAAQDTPAALPAPTAPRIGQPLDATRRTPPVLSPKTERADVEETEGSVTSDTDTVEEPQSADTPSDAEETAENQRDKAVS